MSIRNCIKGLVAASLVVTSVAAAESSDSAQVNLAGSIASTLQVSAQATAGASTLDLSPNQKIVKVADLTMSTNNVEGLTVHASSGNLENAEQHAIAFQVLVGEDEAQEAPAATAFTSASGQPFDHEIALQGEHLRDLWIKYSPVATDDPGNYTGTINVTVTDN
jgi:hypothetical protein